MPIGREMATHGWAWPTPQWLGLDLAGRTLGLIGTGKIVGIGGHVEAGESDAEAVVREVWEETGVVVRQEDLAAAGVVEFIFPTRPEWNMYCRLFTTRRLSFSENASGTANSSCRTPTTIVSRFHVSRFHGSHRNVKRET